MNIRIFYKAIQCAKVDIQFSLNYFLHGLLIFLICMLVIRMYRKVSSSNRRLLKSYSFHINRKFFHSLLISYSYSLFMMTIGNRAEGSRDELQLQLFQTRLSYISYLSYHSSMSSAQKNANHNLVCIFSFIESCIHSEFETISSLHINALLNSPLL